jgi:hypothetical protein
VFLLLGIFTVGQLYLLMFQYQVKIAGTDWATNNLGEKGNIREPKTF